MQGLRIANSVMRVGMLSYWVKQWTMRASAMRKGWGEEWEYWNKIIFLEANIQRKVLILEWGRSENKMTSGQWSGMAVELNQSRGRKTLPSISWWESHLVLLHMTSFLALQVVPALLLLLLLAQSGVSQEGQKVKFGARWVLLPCVRCCFDIPAQSINHALAGELKFRLQGGASQEQVQRSQRQVSVWIHLQGGGEWQGEERHLCAASWGGGRRRRRGK